MTNSGAVLSYYPAGNRIYVAWVPSFDYLSEYGYAYLVGLALNGTVLWQYSFETPWTVLGATGDEVLFFDSYNDSIDLFNASNYEMTWLGPVGYTSPYFFYPLTAKDLFTVAVTLAVADAAVVVGAIAGVMVRRRGPSLTLTSTSFKSFVATM